MATETLRPNDVGNVTDLTGQYPASGQHWQKVDEASPSDADYVYQEYVLAGSAYDVYKTAGLTEAGTISISDVTVYVRCYTDNPDANADHVRPVIIMDGHATMYYVASQHLTTSWAVYSASWDHNPSSPTHEAWTKTEIAAMQPGVWLSINSPHIGYCSQVYAIVTYTVIKNNTETASTSVGLNSSRSETVYFKRTKEATIKFNKSLSRIKGTIRSFSSKIGSNIILSKIFNLSKDLSTFVGLKPIVLNNDRNKETLSSLFGLKSNVYLNKIYNRFFNLSLGLKGIINKIFGKKKIFIASISNNTTISKIVTYTRTKISGIALKLSLYFVSPHLREEFFDTILGIKSSIKRNFVLNKTLSSKYGIKSTFKKGISKIQKTLIGLKSVVTSNIFRVRNFISSISFSRIMTEINSNTNIVEFKILLGLKSLITRRIFLSISLSSKLGLLRKIFKSNYRRFNTSFKLISNKIFGYGKIIKSKIANNITFNRRIRITRPLTTKEGIKSFIFRGFFERVFSVLGLKSSISRSLRYNRIKNTLIGLKVIFSYLARLVVKYNRYNYKLYFIRPEKVLSLTENNRELIFKK